MQLIGHQVVGSKNISHEEVKAMYRKLFGGESIRIKRILKKEFGAIEGKTVLSQIFQVHYVLHNFHYTACNYLPGHRIAVMISMGIHACNVQVIFDSVKKMLVERLLRCPLIAEVLPSQKSSKIEDRVRETSLRDSDDRQRIFQAFKIMEEVSSLVASCC